MSDHANKRPKLDSTGEKRELAGETIVIAGVMIWNEKDESTTWITKKDFKACIEAAGGKVANAVSRNTTLVVKGNVSKVDGQCAETFTAALEQQVDASRKAGPLKVLSFVKVLTEHPALLAAVKKSLSKATWRKDGVLATYKPPEARTEKVLQAALMQQARAESFLYAE